VTILSPKTLPLNLAELLLNLILSLLSARTSYLQEDSMYLLYQEARRVNLLPSSEDDGPC
jgi:hypothetical protein